MRFEGIGIGADGEGARLRPTRFCGRRASGDGLLTECCGPIGECDIQVALVIQLVRGCEYGDSSGISHSVVCGTPVLERKRADFGLKDRWF